jgi:hypothetical protein
MLYVGIVVGIVLVIVVIAVLASLGSVSAAVDVTAINVTSSDNACGVDGHSFSGFTTNSGGAVQDTLTVRNTNTFQTCSIQSVSTTTSGFSLSGANTPISIPAGGTQSLSFTIHAPSGSYNGVVTVDIE